MARSARLLLVPFLLTVTLDQRSSGKTPSETAGNSSASFDGVRVTGLRFQAEGVNGQGAPQSGVSRPAAAAPPPQLGRPPSAASAKLVMAKDLVYQGAFRLPMGAIGGSSFDYGGTALAFNPVRGSLFMVGHAWQQFVAEVTVPTIRGGAGWSDLPFATVLQPFTDATEGLMKNVSANPGDSFQVGGLLAYKDRLYLSVYVYYDASGSQKLSHFVSGLDLSVSGDVRGPYQVGTLGAGFVSGYFGLVPSGWQEALGGPVLNGNCCLSIISRTSYGPAVFAIDPAQLGSTPAKAVPLVYYTDSHPLGPWGGDSVVFNGSTNVDGIVFPEGTRSVLFFGRQGLGPWCYGDGPACNDPTSPAKGGHGYPYAYYVWAYDATDLAAVKSGKRKPWDVKPYATWKLDLPFAGFDVGIKGVAYDPATGRIFVSQYRSDGDNPLIHILTVQP